MFKVIYKKLVGYIIFAISLFILLYISFFPTFLDLNNLVLDRLQQTAEIKARSEIVVVGIDDESLQQIGAWPWERQIFAKAFENILAQKPRVVGVDVLFLESRTGDREFGEVVKNSNAPIVFGSKLEDKTLYKSKFEGKSVDSGLIDFAPDSDGKIRSITLAKDTPVGCQSSFALAVFKKYLSLNSQPDCNQELTLRSQTYPKKLNILYPSSLDDIENSFTQVSFKDVWQGSLGREVLKDKIVLIGSVAKDLKNNLNDNFIDIFSRQTPGILIHASSLNTLLEKKIQQTFPVSWFSFLLALFSIGSYFIYQKLAKNHFEITYFLLSLILNNLSGIVLFSWSINWYFIQTNLAIIFTYISYVIFKFLVIQKESRFLQSAFGQYVNPKLLSQLIQNPEQLKLGGEKKTMTVLFSDIRGFTSFSEKMSPEELVQLINNYLGVMTRVILDHNGTIDKFIGDAIMAFWNAPLDDPKHQESAVLTAIAMEQELAKFNAKYNTDIKIGIGLNTGEMVVGNIGSNLRFDYTILGDNVNLGSRLEGLTKKYGVTTIVAESVIQKNYNSDIIFRLLDETKVKGKNEAIKIYEPLVKNTHNLDLKSDFEKAFVLYQQGKFDLAVKAFMKIKTDQPSLKMIERIKHIDETRKADWTGVWKWDEK